MMRALYSLLGGVTEATGNVVDAGGAFSFEHIIESFEHIELTFDEHLRPIMPQIHCQPDTAEKLEAVLESATPQQMERLNAIIKQKRQEHDDRRRTRRLRS